MARVKLPVKPAKYRNVKTTVDGYRFASKKEANRYGELKLLERAGAIEGLELQRSFTIAVNGEVICRYVADFTYFEVKSGVWVVEDVKSAATKTPVYLLKKKLMKVCLGIEIREI